MGYRPPPPRLTAREKAQAGTLQKRSDLATQLKLARPDHAWIPHPRNKVYCARCSAKSPFKMDMARHLYIVKEWP